MKIAITAAEAFPITIRNFFQGAIVNKDSFMGIHIKKYSSLDELTIETGLNENATDWKKNLSTVANKLVLATEQAESFAEYLIQKISNKNIKTINKLTERANIEEKEHQLQLKWKAREAERSKIDGELSQKIKVERMKAQQKVEQSICPKCSSVGSLIALSFDKVPLGEDFEGRHEMTAACNVFFCRKCESASMICNEVYYQSSKYFKKAEYFDRT